jgi:hypothetical protein
MSEANAITAGLLAEIPKRYLRIRVWRNNRVKAMAIGRGGKPRLISAGVDGQADITGIAGPSGRKIEVEIKAGRDRLSEDQLNFRRMILSHGGVYVVAQSVEDGLRALDAQLTEEEREKRKANIGGSGEPGQPPRARKKRTTGPHAPVRTEPHELGFSGA